MRQRFPTPALTRRLLQNSGRLPGENEAWPTNIDRAPALPAPPGTALDDLIQRLKDLLSNLPNVNVRPPSHVRPPFRAVQWAFTAAKMVDSSTPISDLVIAINGNQAMPAGMNGVLAFVDVTLVTFDRATGTTGQDYFDYTNSGAVPTTWTIKRNGSALPGFLNRFPNAGVGGSLQNGGGATFLDTWFGMPNGCVTVCSPTLLPTDRLTITVTGAQTLAVPAEAVITVLGWIYPQERTGDGIKGTMADTWKTVSGE